MCSCISGDATVGKSSLCQGFHSDGSHFLKNYSMVGHSTFSRSAVSLFNDWLKCKENIILSNRSDTSSLRLN